MKNGLIDEIGTIRKEECIGSTEARVAGSGLRSACTGKKDVLIEIVTGIQDRSG